MINGVPVASATISGAQTVPSEGSTAAPTGRGRSFKLRAGNYADRPVGIRFRRRIVEWNRTRYIGSSRHCDPPTAAPSYADQAALVGLSIRSWLDLLVAEPVDTNERISLINSGQFPSVLSYEKCDSCGLVANDLGLIRVKAQCPNCGAEGPRLLYPDVVSMTLLEAIGHFYRAAHVASESQLKQLQSAVEDVTGKRPQARALTSVTSQLRRMYASHGGSQQAYNRLLKHASNTLGAKDASVLRDILPQLVFFTGAQPEHVTVVLHTCALVEHLFQEVLVELRHRRLGATYPAARDYVGTKRRGLRQLMDLLRDMLDVDLDGLVVDLGYAEWNASWTKLRKRRNDFLHGGLAPISSAEADEAFDVAVNSSWVFAQLRNRLLGIRPVVH